MAEPRSEIWYLEQLLSLSNKHNELLLKHANTLRDYNNLIEIHAKALEEMAKIIDEKN